MPQGRKPQLWVVLLVLAGLALSAYRGARRLLPAPAAGHAYAPRGAAGAGGGARGIRCASTYYGQWRTPAPGVCRTRMVDGNLLPDPRCTPGGVDPSITADMLRDRSFSTRCDRDCASSHAQKLEEYSWYGIERPRGNQGPRQVCELDHLVPLALGGADGLGHLWPECGPAGAALAERSFKIKDRVENYLADAVKAGRMPLAEAQRGIAEDWSRYLPAANQYCAQGGRC